MQMGTDGCDRVQGCGQAGKQDKHGHTAGLVHDFQKNDQSAFYQYLIFLDETYCDHHYITCTFAVLDHEN